MSSEIRLIDSYCYCSKKGKKKEEKYISHVYSEQEKAKTASLKKRMEDFIRTVYGNDGINYLNSVHCSEGHIRFFEGKGYITFDNPDYDEVKVYCYGNDEEEAFTNAIISYVLYNSICIETDYREKLDEDYKQRFSDDVNTNYHGTFYFAELSLRAFRKFYGNNIPQGIVEYFERYVSTTRGINYKYDYETDSLVLRSKCKGA